MDNNYNEVFTDKATSITEVYFKQIALPRNGVYYLLINEGIKNFVRKTTRE